jgi:hypothetical protein
MPAPNEQREALQRVAVGDTVQMRKVHACGSHLWTVYRTGTDIGLQCQGCGRRVMLARSVFLQMAKRIVTASSGTAPDDRSVP